MKHVADPSWFRKRDPFQPSNVVHKAGCKCGWTAPAEDWPAAKRLSDQHVATELGNAAVEAMLRER